MLHLAHLLALASAVTTTPSALPAPSPAALPAPTTVAMPAPWLAGGAPAATRNTTAIRGIATPPAPKQSLIQFPWTRYLTVEQQNAAMRAELDAEFNVDHSP